MSRQAVAFEKLKRLAQPSEFQKQLDLLPGEDHSPTSCMQNALLITRYLTNQPMSSMGMTGLKSIVRGGTGRVLTSEVKKKLKQPVLLYFKLRFFGANSSGGGDHHFCAFGLDKNTVIAAMGWQNIYTLVDWFRENEEGRYKTENFLDHLRSIEAQDCNGVIDLCAYLGVVSQGPQSGRGVISVLTADLVGLSPQVESSFYLDLPRA